MDHHPMTSSTPASRAATINIRAQVRQRDLIDRAAAALGRNRSDFMLDVVCRAAEEVLLDRCYLELDPEAWQRFTAMLDAPAAPSAALTRLMTTKPVWEA